VRKTQRKKKGARPRPGHRKLRRKGGGGGIILKTRGKKGQSASSQNVGKGSLGGKKRGGGFKEKRHEFSTWGSKTP